MTLGKERHVMLSTYYIIITAAEVQMSKTHSFDAFEYLLEVESTYFKFNSKQASEPSAALTAI